MASQSFTTANDRDAAEAQVRLVQIVSAVVEELHPGQAAAVTLDTTIDRDLGLDSLARVELVAIGPFSIDLEIHCFIRTRDHAEFLAIRRELLLQIVRIVEDAGTGLAAPGQTHYLRESKLATGAE